MEKQPALCPLPVPEFGAPPLPAMCGAVPPPQHLCCAVSCPGKHWAVTPLCWGLSLPAVAQRIIEKGEHTVELNCGQLEELTQSSRSILVSDLPSLDIPKEALLDKLELFFSKTKNGGSEVESREFLEDSEQVVLTFTQDGVAEPLIERGHIQVPIGKGKYKIKISPCMCGDISNLQVRLQPSRCPRTVLLLGIPDVLSVESMRDALEIHFQKASRGGGEVDALAYVPAGRSGVAVFVEDTTG
uniref:NID domain-containing protein n=1 Tax=Geospiza parvula TaxID=87175 RepID=A0A8C3MFP9_GEOPR